MKKSLLIALLLISAVGQAATYYVATNGSDNNPGTIAQPWLTIQKGFNSISPGDILYIRGGTYLPTGTISGGLISGAVANGKNGTANNMYTVSAYPGEFPILDCRNITNPNYGRVGILILSSDYWHVKGIEITRVDQNEGPTVQRGQGLLVQSGNYNKIEFITAHHCGGPGIELRDESEGNVFINCDSYSNWDPYSGTPGDDADGFDVGFIYSRPGNDRINTLIGCRAWANSDDGFDLYQYPGYHGIYIMENSWAWENGYTPDGVTRAGDGNGFKLGADNNFPLDATVRRSLYNCIAYNNRQRGFSQESANVKMLFYNNIAYRNGTWGLSFYYYDVADILRNNISYKNYDGQIENQGVNRIHDHNTWDSKVTLSDADFVSLDATQLERPRKTDGSLPDMTFFHLATGSDLIDAGTNVGFPFSGNAPDMGAFEIQAGSVSSDPVFISASVENSATSVVALNYDLDLNNLIIPAAASFSVKVNSQSKTISAVSISGKKVSLTLASPMVFGDIITVAYTKPASKPLQTPPGKQAASLAASPVTNNLRDPGGQNDPPSIVVANKPDIYSGFVGEIDASGTSDLNNDMLTFNWTPPSNVSVSSTTATKIKFLAPMIKASDVIKFKLDVSDGTVVASKTISVNVTPYKPGSRMARIDSLVASSYQDPDYPKNVSDGNQTTLWSAEGDNQWLLLKLAVPFKISHLEIAFLKDQTYSSVFDIYASKDNLIWEPVLIHEISCNFSGNIQVFDFPLTKTNTAYSYIKLVGHGNTLNKTNNISELGIKGVMVKTAESGSATDADIFIYPNPATDYVNISVEEPTLNPDVVVILDLSGKIVYSDSFGQGIKNIQLPASLRSGIYVVELRSGDLIIYASKLLIHR